MYFFLAVAQRHNDWRHKHCVRHLHRPDDHHGQLPVFKPVARSVHDHGEQGRHSGADRRHPGADVHSHHFGDGSGDGGGSGAVGGAAGRTDTHQRQLCCYGRCCCGAQPGTDGVLAVRSGVSARTLIITSSSQTSSSAVGLNDVVCVCSGALLSLTPGGLGSALSPALMSNSTLATIQGVYQCKSV